MSDSCGHCKRGEYLCPSDQQTCVASADAYKTCPGLKGTHLDWSLSEDERLDYLVHNTTTEEQAAQLTNTAPAIERLGIPAYQWLNDDQHGVGRTDGMMPGPVHRTQPKATILPNGCGLGATWSKQTVAAAGKVLGTEARGLHNGFVHMIGGHDSPAAQSCNGCGITLYAPYVVHSCLLADGVSVLSTRTNAIDLVCVLPWVCGISCVCYRNLNLVRVTYRYLCSITFRVSVMINC